MKKKTLNYYLLKYHNHIGYKKNSNNPYIIGYRNNISILNLEYSQYYLKRALKIIFKMLQLNKNIVIIGSKDKKFNKKVKKYYKNIFFYSQWVGGLLSNSKRFDKEIKKPSLIIFFDLNINNKIGINEAKKLNIPIMAFINNNEDTRNILFSIPGNTESPTVLNFYSNLFLFLVKKVQNKKYA